MKKILTIVIFGLFTIVGLFAQELNYELIDEGEIEGFFSYVSIATEQPEVALTLAGEWGTNIEDSVEITTEEIDKILPINSRELLDEELSERIGVYLYLYTEANVRMAVIYEDGILYVMADNNEVLEALRTNKDVLIKGIFNI